MHSLVKRLLLSGEGTKSSSGHKVGGGAFKEIKVGGGRMRHIAFNYTQCCVIMYLCDFSCTPKPKKSWKYFYRAIMQAICL